MSHPATPGRPRRIRFRSALARLAGAGLLLSSPVGLAQLGLPRLPSLPVLRPAATLGTDLQPATTLADPATQTLIDARGLAARHLIRNNRATIEADPAGDPIVRAQLLAYAPTESAIQQAVATGFTVLRRLRLEGLDVELVLLQAPANMTTRRALERLLTLDPRGTYDYNHLYMTSGAPGNTDPTPASALPSAGPATNEHFDLGLIDGGINLSHPVFRGMRVASAGCGGTAIATTHGTAIASLLVGAGPHFRGARPGASLLAVDVFCGVATGGAADSVAGALALMAKMRVPIINVSLVGPPNRLLEQVVKALQARGALVVAAVGNDGPSAPPLYPAAYPGVVAVTAVDVRSRVLPEACRGAHVQFAAPGADLLAADAAGGYQRVRGTSFASPIVAGLLSTLLATSGPDTAGALQQLQLQAKDLGTPGRDPVYGFGLVGENLLHNEEITTAAE